jgi:transposase
MVAIPTIEEEDAKRPNRERETLIRETTRLINRLKACLVRFGVRGFDPTLRRAADRLALISHRTNARLGGQSDRHVSGVAGMLAGGAGRRGECWNHFALPAQRRIDVGGPWDDAA